MNERLKALLRSAIAAHDDAQLMTTPHLSRIRHAEEWLLRLLELKSGEPDPVDFRDARIAELEAAVKAPMTEAAMTASRATGLPFVEVKAEALAPEDLSGMPGPIHDLIGAIRGAIAAYDETNDHCSHDAQSDCVRCNAAAAVYYDTDPRCHPPGSYARRRAEQAKAARA